MILCWSLFLHKDNDLVLCFLSHLFHFFPRSLNFTLVPRGPSLPPTISSRLLLLKSLDVFNSEGALIIDSAPLKCEKCSSTFDSVDSLRRHSLSVDICKNCHAPNPSSSSSFSSASHLRKPSILKRKPVQALCRKCSSSGGKTLKTGC